MNTRVSVLALCFVAAGVIFLRSQVLVAQNDQSLSASFADAESIADSFHVESHDWRPRVAARRSSEASWAVYEQQQAALRRAQQARLEAIRQQQLAVGKAREEAKREREQRILNQEHVANNWFDRGRQALLANRYQEAISYFRKAIQQWPAGQNPDIENRFVQNLKDAMEQQNLLNSLRQGAQQALRWVAGPGTNADSTSLQVAGPGTDADSTSLEVTGPGTDADSTSLVIAVAPDGSKLTAPKSLAGYEQKGFDAIRVHDWPVALAWYETAQLKDPGNSAVARMVGLLKELVKRDGDPYSYYSGSGVVLPKQVTSHPPAPPDPYKEISKADAGDTPLVARLVYYAGKLGIVSLSRK